MPLLIGILSGQGLVAFLVTVLILAIIIYVIKLLLDWIAVPQQIKTIAWLIIAVVVIIFLLNRFVGISL